MHIPDGVLSPTALAITTLTSVVGLGWCLRRIQAEFGDRTPLRMGSMAAFVFVAQMINFPIPMAGFSGHLLGGTLAAVLLGPWAGAGAIALVLLVQCFLFGDGGVTVLGANFLNMGLIGALAGFGIYSPLRRKFSGRAGALISSMVAAWFSTILAAGAFALEMAASGRFHDFAQVLGWMILVHAAIGIGEALITGIVIRSLLQTRPDLLQFSETPESSPIPSRAQTWLQSGFAGLAISMAMALFLTPLAVASPDGLEWVSERLGFGSSQPSMLSAPMPDYQAPGLSAQAAASAAAGFVGTITVFLAGWMMARGLGLSVKKGTEVGSTRGLNADAA